ncbi:MAG: DUF1638 domain-containing protein [Thermoleophilia bacterium]
MAAPPKIISCEVLRNEIEAVNPGHEIEFIDGALHDYPEKLRAALQGRISATPGEREILLCCGRCSNGTAGLEAGPHRLVLPAVDDCIALLLGSRRRYLEVHGREPGTFYYTRGWIDFIDDPYKWYLETVPRFGEEKAASLARQILANYTRVAVIVTPGIDIDEARPYLRRVTEFYDLPLDELSGSLRFLEKLVAGPHDEEFIVVEPGERLEERRFWALDKA